MDGDGARGRVGGIGGGPIRGFQDLDVWQLGKQLVVVAYGMTAHFPSTETYGLCSQIRRAAASVPGNVAEAFGRYHYLDKVRFLLNARGSLHELKSHFLIAQDLGLVDNAACQATLRRIDALSVKLNNLITVTRRQLPRQSPRPPGARGRAEDQ